MTDQNTRVPATARFGRYVGQLCLLAVAGVYSPAALAHLTWLELDETELRLTTGHNYPTREIQVAGRFVEKIVCKADGVLEQLEFARNSRSFAFKVNPNNCLAELQTSTINLSVAQGLAHFEESKAPKDLIERLRGQTRFDERYKKTAQLKPIQIGSALYREDLVQFVLKPGDNDSLYLYRDGKPLAAQAVGLSAPGLPFAVWSSSDATGRVEFAIQPDTPALVHATVIQAQGDAYETQFVSLLYTPKK